MESNKDDRIDLSGVNKAPSASLIQRVKGLFKKSQYPGRDAEGKFVAGSSGIKFGKKLEVKRVLPLVIVISLVGGLFVYRSFAAVQQAPAYDFATYFPNNQLFKSQYLEGNNYVNGSPERSVLWFEPQDQYTFKMYNAAPQNQDRRCHSTVLSWWPDNTLRYSETASGCAKNSTSPSASSVPNKIVYDAKSPIILLPRKMVKGEKWQYNGKTTAQYFEQVNGKFQLKCTGSVTYTSRILGQEKVTPREDALRFQKTQATTWQTGAVPGKCVKGETTRWQEDYWLTDTLKAQGGGTTKGLRRAKGGNQDLKEGSWDVWYDGWAILPKLASDDTVRQ
ncbi:MAG: hypothetical protein U0520_02030 [Candidatus Saccharimonadales bacterium]